MNILIKIILKRLFYLLLTDTSSIIVAWKGLGTIISIVMMIFAFKELKLLRKQIESNQKNECCKLTIDLLLNWSQNLTSDMSRSRKIVEQFDIEQCKKLFDNELFEVKPKQYKYICRRIYKRDPYFLSNRVIKLKPLEVNTLRDDVIKYLNLLESILAARQYGVADDELITKEFKYLVKSKSGECVLSVFREAMGDIESYPAIKKFCEDMNKKSKQSD